MKDTFYGYIANGELYGIFYEKDDSLKNVVEELGFKETKGLFEQAKWVLPSSEMSEREADNMGCTYPKYLFIELCRTKSIKETLETQHGIMKALNSRPNDPVFDGMLDEESEKELQEEAKNTLNDLKNAKVLELFNQAYKLKGDYRNAEKYYVVDFDENRVNEN